MELNRIINDDCLNVLKQIESGSIDLVVTDPPYLIKNTKAGGKSDFAKSIQKMNDEIKLFLNAHGTMFVGKTYDYSQRILKFLIWPDDDDEFNYGNEMYYDECYC